MRLGPIVCATLVVRDLDLSRRAYVGQLGLVPCGEGPLPRQRALDMGDPVLADAACLSLRSAPDTEACVVLVEAATASPATAFAQRGWAALALAVNDVAALAARLDPGCWRALPQPATDGVLQVVGVDGEVLQLVQSPQWLAPCAIETARCTVDRVVAATLIVRDCGVALGFYEGLGLVASWRQASPEVSGAGPAIPPAPLALAQLRGRHAIVFDQQPALPTAGSTVRSGVRLLSFARSDASGRRLVAGDDPSARILAGPDGEAIELL